MFTVHLSPLYYVNPALWGEKMEKKKGLKDITNEEAIAHLDTLVCQTFARGKQILLLNIFY